MVLKNLDNNFDLFIDQIKQQPHYCETILNELNLWLSSDENNGDKISCIIDILYTILENRADLADAIFETSLLTYKYNDVLSYSLLINLIHNNNQLADPVFSVLKDYILKKSSEGLLVCLFQLINKLAIQHNNIKDKIRDFINYALTLETNSEFSKKEAQLALINCK